MTPFKSYIICTSPRSGSTLLCRLLEGTSKAGKPDSHFHTPSLEVWLQTYGLSNEPFASDKAALKAVFQAAKRHGTGQADIFGMRLQQASLAFFSKQLAVLYPDVSTTKSRIDAAFGKTLFIYLTRENKLEQAISYVKASQTGLWHKSADGTELERVSPVKDPVFDATAIAEQMGAASKMDEAWATWFAKEQINPLCITYDDISSDSKGVLGRILGSLGISFHMPKDDVLPLAKLADATSKDWAVRFNTEYQNP